MDASRPILSIVIPVYNTESYLPACIDSILAQSFGDFELLLIDDGSKDGSYGICCDYAQRDSRVKVFHQENAGPSAARNLGMDNARGKYLMFVDSDDELAPGTLEENMGYLLEHPEVKLLQFPMEAHYPDGRTELRYNRSILLEGLEEINAIWCRSADIINGFFGGKIYHNSLLDGIRLPVEMRNSEDSWLLCEVLLRCEKIYLSSQGAYRYNLREGSLSTPQNQTQINTHCANNLRVLHNKLQNANKLELSREIKTDLCGYIFTVLNGYVNRRNVPVETLQDLLRAIEKDFPSCREILFSGARMKSKTKCLLVKMLGLGKATNCYKKLWYFPSFPKFSIFKTHS